MSKFLGTYIPEEVSLNVGPLNITGFAEGTCSAGRAEAAPGADQSAFFV